MEFELEKEYFIEVSNLVFLKRWTGLYSLICFIGKSLTLTHDIRRGTRSDASPGRHQHFTSIQDQTGKAD